MPHPERACEHGTRQRRRRSSSSSRSCSTGLARAARPPSRRCIAGRRRRRRAPRLSRRRPFARPPRQLDAATSTTRIVAILGREPNLTELGIFSVMWREHCSYKSSRVHLQDASRRRAARAAGPGRERRRRRHRRRPGGGLQDRVAQPPVVHRAVPGRGDGRRRHHPRHLHDGRAADRAAELAALRPAPTTPRRPDGCSRASSPASRDYGNCIGVPTVGGEIVFDDELHRQPAGQRLLPRASPRHDEIVKRHAPRASATPCSTSAPRPAATASTARPWRRAEFDDESRGEAAQPCRSAIRSWRSCCSRRASR